MAPERQCPKKFLIRLAEPTKALERRSERHAVSIAQQAITPTKPNLDETSMAIITDPELRYLPKIVWILLVIFLPFV